MMQNAIKVTPIDTLLDQLGREHTIMLESYEPNFTLQAGLCSNYSCLLKGEYSEEQEIDGVLKMAVTSGRVILSGRGASGKTVFLRRLSLLAINSGIVAIFIDLSKWTPSATEFFQTASNSPLEKFGYLLRNFAAGSLNTAALDVLPANTQKLIVVDGINETPGKNADQILLACDTATATLPGFSCIISDRLVRRNLVNESAWKYLSLLPLNADKVGEFYNSKHMSYETATLLNTPLFLDRALRDGIENSAVNTIKSMFSEHGALDDAEFNIVSITALEIYRSIKSRTFPKQYFEDQTSHEILGKLISANIISSSENAELFFTHHLYHDFLAASAIAQSEDLWGSDTRQEYLDALTFSGNSFDAVSYVLQLIPSVKTDEFLSVVYDWNPYAAGYALADVETNTPISVSNEIRTIVLAMLALRKFDHQVFTQQKARDALDLFRDDFAKSLANTSDLAELLDIVGQIDSDDTKFNEWKTLFIRKPDEQANLDDVLSLRDPNSILGWTASNVLKRLTLNEEQMGQILRFIGHESAVVRWRAVHVSGAIIAEDIIEALFESVISDADKYVRFGAIRSLIELAHRAPRFTDQIIDGIIEKMPQLRTDKLVISELKNSIFIAPDLASANWINKVTPIFNSLIDLSQTVEELEVWSASTAKIRILYK